MIQGPRHLPPSVTEEEDDAFVVGESELPDSNAQFGSIELIEAYYAIISKNLAQGLLLLLTILAIGWYQGGVDTMILYDSLQTPWVVMYVVLIIFFTGVVCLINLAFGDPPFGTPGDNWSEPDEEDGFLSIRELVEDRIDMRRSFEKAIPGGSLTWTTIFLLSVSSCWYFVWAPVWDWSNNEESIIVSLLNIISFPFLLFIIFKILAIIDDEWIRFRRGYGLIHDYNTTQLAKAALAELGAKQSTMSQREFRRRFDILKKRLEDVQKTMGEPSLTTSHRTPEDPSQGVVAPALQESQGDSFFKKYDTANYPFCHSCGRQVLPGVLRTCDKCGKQRCINCGGSGHCRDCNRGVYH